MDLDFLRRGFSWFGESDPMAACWLAADPGADDEDDEDEGDSYSRGGDLDDDEDEFDDEDDEEDDGHDAGGTLWASRRRAPH